MRRKRRKRSGGREPINKVKFTMPDIQSAMTGHANKPCFAYIERYCYELNCVSQRHVEIPTSKDENHNSKSVIN